jgi:hypothetical protein
VEQFVEENQGGFLALSAVELLRCADISITERGGSVSAARQMIQYGIQVLMREGRTNYSLIGTLYKRLIHLSPTRYKVSEEVYSVLTM